MRKATRVTPSSRVLPGTPVAAPMPPVEPPRDPRIEVKTFVRHVTPDNKEHETAEAAERHLRWLDQQARERKLMDEVAGLYWGNRTEALGEKYDWDGDRFVNAMKDFLLGYWDEIKFVHENFEVLSPLVTEIKEAKK